MKTSLLSYCAHLLLAIACLVLPALSQANAALVLTIAGTVGPATPNYVAQGLQTAAARKATVVILRLDTAGGLESAMHKIDKAIVASTVPVIAYVAPTGAHVASAGTFIVYASHIAAMAPGTTLESASPVNMLASPSKVDQANLSTTEHQELKDATTNIRALAALRGRNIAWAEQAVMAAASISATDALKTKVIDVIATDVPDLLKQVNGKTVSVNGVMQKLDTSNVTVTDFNPSLFNKILATITNPDMAYILLLLGIYGLFFEFYHAGLIAPGVIGGIALLLALYAFYLLPINYVGFALLLLGIIFMMIEVLISSFGILAVGGIIAFVTGSILLLDINSPGYQIAWSLITMMTVFTVGFFLLIVTLSIRAHQRKVMSDRDSMIGAQGHVLEYLHGHWLVRIDGEIWQADCAADLKVGQKIKVSNVTGLILTIVPLRTKQQRELTNTL